ncbi:MAG: hypothetical protein ACKPKO_25370, partial [Candidatus Fonsibacter sp.]
MSQVSVDMQCMLDVDSHIVWAITCGTLRGPHLRSLRQGCLAMSQTQQASCKSWVAKEKNKQFVWTNAGRRKSESSFHRQLLMQTWVDHPTQARRVVQIPQAL